VKDIKDLLSQTPVYLHNWTEKMDVIANFENIYITSEEYKMEKSPYHNEEYFQAKKNEMTKALEKYKDVNILFATYGTDNWSGDAFVLFEQNGKLYEVNGSHCSCYGLEDQWCPEEVLLPELENRLIKGTFGKNDYSGNEFRDDLVEFLGVAFNGEVI
jgi:hypothetical protein